MPPVGEQEDDAFGCERVANVRVESSRFESLQPKAHQLHFSLTKASPSRDALIWD
jgi:hypothetical protein